MSGLFDALNVMNVLLVDDDPLVLSLLNEALRAGDRKILTAASGEEAWEILGRTEIHVVVSDMRMSGMDGLELCRRVRARKSQVPSEQSRRCLAYMPPYLPIPMATTTM